MKKVISITILLLSMNSHASYNANNFSSRDVMRGFDSTAQMNMEYQQHMRDMVDNYGR